MPWSRANYDDSDFLDTGVLFIASLMGSRSQMAWCKHRHHVLYMSFFFFLFFMSFFPEAYDTFDSSKPWPADVGPTMLA